VRESKVQRHASAERVPDHRRPLDPEMVEERAQVAQVRERPAWQGGLSEATEIDADDAVGGREGRSSCR
jgi:hypothetical protein